MEERSNLWSRGVFWLEEFQEVDVDGAEERQGFAFIGLKKGMEPQLDSLGKISNVVFYLGKSG